MKEINLHAAIWAFFFIASWTFWLVYHNLVVSEYELALVQESTSQKAIQACLNKGYLFHSWPDHFGKMHVRCRLKDPGPIFASYKEYKRYMRAVGGR